MEGWKPIRAIYKTRVTKRAQISANIIRANLHNRSVFVLFPIFDICFKLLFLRMGQDQTTSSHFSTTKTLTSIQFQQVYQWWCLLPICKLTYWYKWFRQHCTRLTTNLRLENKLKNKSIEILVHSPFFEVPLHKNGFTRRLTNLPFSVLFTTDIRRSHTCSSCNNVAPTDFGSYSFYTCSGRPT